MLDKFLQKQVAIGISVLRQGGLVAFPTDTVYGLGVGVDIPQAVERVYKAKGRPANMALPLLLADISQISEVAESVPPIAWVLAKKFLPSPVTTAVFFWSLWLIRSITCFMPPEICSTCLA